MNGPIAQIVALALHGNAVLSGANSTDFLAQNSTAQFCQSIQFVLEEPTWFGFGTPEKRTMISPEQWFADLKQRKAIRIGVRWVTSKEKSAPDRMLAGFVGGGGTWTMQIQFPDGTFEQWVSEWAVDEPRRKIDGKIWKVNYRRAYSGKESLSAVPVSEAKRNLELTLTDIQAFSSRKDVKPFTAMFEKALSALRREPGSEGYHRDLSLKALAGDSYAILNAAQHAWVFGGMGSWNDIGFDGNDAKEYDRVSERLYQALVRAIPAAVDGADI